jgi:membrane protease YdiL (CAAX protease family)
VIETARPDTLAPRLRGFRPLGIFAILLIYASQLLASPLGGVLVLVWAWRSHTPWREIGYARPKNWIASVAIGTAFGVAFKLLMKTIVMPLLGAPELNQAYHYVVGNTLALIELLFVVTILGGFAEETVFRGYLFERLGKLIGTSARSKMVTVLLTTGLFALPHSIEQGLAGVQQATFTGLVFGTIFAITGRIGLPMVAHAVFDVTALVIIYWNLESALAHLIFK